MNEHVKSNCLELTPRPSIKYSYTQSKIELHPYQETKLERVPENLKNLLLKTKIKPQSAPSAYQGVHIAKIEKKKCLFQADTSDKKLFLKKPISLKKVTLRGSLANDDEEECISTFPFFTASRPLKESENPDQTKKSVFPIVHLFEDEIESVEPFNCKLGPPAFKPGLANKNVLHRAREVANKRMKNSIGLVSGNSGSSQSLRRISSASRKLGRLQSTVENK